MQAQTIWDTQITISVSDNLTIYKAARLPFKNMLKVACTNGVKYCASTFKEDKRDYAHWNNGAQIIVLDFDEGLNENTKSWLNNQLGFLIPTKSHNKNKGGLTCERYRAILLADRPLSVSAQEYVQIYQNLLKDNNLPGDKACTDVSRIYYSYSDNASMKDIRILAGKPLDWTKYNYKDTMQMIGLPSPKKIVDISKYEDKIDLSFITSLNKSKRYECPICALDGLDPHKHHLGFSSEKDLLTCFYDKEGHSPILRALYRKQILGLDPEIDEDTQEIVEEEVKQEDGKVKKKRVVKPKTEPCSACNGTGKITCTECMGEGFKVQGMREVKEVVNERGQVSSVETYIGTKKTECEHCKGVGFFPCPECQGTGQVPKKPKPRVKKPSLPDDMIPTRVRIPKGSYHYNECGPTLDFDAEYAKYANDSILGFDVETFYPKEVTITEEEAKEMFKETHISIAATYKRVVKNFHEMALDEIDNQVRLIILGNEVHQTAFDLYLCTQEQKERLFKLISSKLIVGHNLKFDIKSLASTYGFNVIPKQVFDTMLASQILWMADSSYEPVGTHSYGSVVERFCGVKLPKDQGGSDWGADQLSEEQFVYAVNDVRFLIPTFKKMVEALFKEYKTNYKVDPALDIEKLRPILGNFIDIHPIMALEMRTLLAFARMELRGVKVDESAIRNAVKELLVELDEAEKKLGFNPASNPESLKFVKQVIGPQATSASKEALAEYYHIPEIEILGRAKQAKARAGLFVKMYEHKADGRIHPQFFQILSTGRVSCKNPNMQQIPRTAKDFIYKAPAGRVVFSADYPAIELRLCGAYHKEPVMIEAFRHGEDLHYKMAGIMTGKPIPKTDEEKHDERFINKEERTAAKNANFGFIYGSWWTSYQQVQLVKNKIKVTDADAKKARETFMRLYSTVARNLEMVKHRYKKGAPRKLILKDSQGNDYTQMVPYGECVHTLMGRRLFTETANTNLNYGIQGSGGECSKLAMCVFEDLCTQRNLDAYLINMIHDDIVCESSIKDKEMAMKTLADAMNFAANFVMGHLFTTDVSEEVDVFSETPEEVRI